MSQQTQQYKGETVEVAIENALKSLNVSRDDIEINVIDEGHYGIFKFRNKPAIIEVTIKNSVLETEKKEHTFTTETAEKSVHSLAAIQDGTFQFIRKGERAIKVNKPDNVQVYLNNELVLSNEFEVFPDDEVTFELLEERKEPFYKLAFSQNKAEAILTVEPGYVKTFTLQDHRPSSMLTVQLIEKSVEYIYIEEQAIYKEIENKGIIYGIDRDAILQSCLSKEAGEFIIAKGDMPVEGKHGWLEYKVKVEAEANFVEKEDGTVDFRDKGAIPSVDEGVEVAIICEPIEGKPGKSVTGQIIPPKPVYPIQVNLGNGVQLKEDGKTIVATTWGRPSFEKRGNSVKAEILPKFTHSGDVNLASGNLNFSGDIEITGNVEDGMKVKATGNIEIRGSVSHAEIIAGKSVVIYGNISSSKVIAGNSQRFLAEMSQSVKGILDELRLIYNAAKQLINSNAGVKDKSEREGVFPLLKFLITNKFPGIRNNIKKLSDNVKEHEQEVDENWLRVMKTLHETFILMNRREKLSFNQFEEIIASVEELYSHTLIDENDFASITITSAMNSDIFSSGDITVLKQGCYNTIIYAGGHLRVEGTVRGGRIFAKHGAQINEAGSRGGAPTDIIVPMNEQIHVRKAMAETVLQIGKQKRKLTNDEVAVKARIDETGRLTLF